MREVIRGITWLLGTGYDCNVYIIESDGNSLLIDSGLGDKQIYGVGLETNSLPLLRKMIKEKNINQVLLTHGHIDHVGGIMALQSDFNFEIITSDIEAKFLVQGKDSYIDPILGSSCDPVKISKTVKENDTIKIGKFIFKVLLTPGHTAGSICLWDEAQNILISGDTVFPQGSFGRTDLPSGNSNQLILSLERLAKLKINVLLPGHMSPQVSDNSDIISSSLQESYRSAKIMLSYY